MSARAHIFDHQLLQELGALYAAAVLLTSIGMFTYWFVTARQVLFAAEEQLSDPELDRLHWPKRFLDFCARLVAPLHWAAL